VATKVGQDLNNVSRMTELFGATRAPSAANACGDSSLPWNQGLILFNTGIDGEDLQTEYFVTMTNAVEAIKAVKYSEIFTFIHSFEKRHEICEINCFHW
jgi:hypothetical protein